MIELPTYRLPAAKNVFTHVWERVSHFIEKAGTIIFAMSVVLWFLQSFDLSFDMVQSAETSILGRLGSFIAPVFSPMGYGCWQAAVALLTGIIAKEAVVSSLAMFCGFSLSAGGGAVQSALSGIFTPRSAYAFLVFVLLYTPCMAAVAGQPQVDCLCRVLPDTYSIRYVVCSIYCMWAVHGLTEVRIYGKRRLVYSGSTHNGMDRILYI